MMMKAIVLFSSAMTLAEAARPLLRRTRRVAFAEFGRGIDPQSEHEKLFREEAKYRLLMSVGGANSIPGADLSMAQPSDSDLSMPMDTDFSMPFDDAMSTMLFDDAMSMPLDTDMSMPFDDAMSIDLALSMATPVETADACDEDNPSTPVSKSFEVDGPVGILSDALSAAVQEDFTLCPSTARMLWETERDLDESVVLGVEVKGVTADDSASCSDGAVDKCEVATAEFDVFYKEESTKDAATDEFLTKLSMRLAEVDGVRERDTSTPPAPKSSSTETNTVGVDSSDRGLGGGEKAATIVCSLAAVAVVLVLVQRKMSKNKRDDDKSVADSTSTSQNTSAYTSSNSIF